MYNVYSYTFLNNQHPTYHHNNEYPCHEHNAYCQYTDNSTNQECYGSGCEGRQKDVKEVEEEFVHFVIKPCGDIFTFERNAFVLTCRTSEYVTVISPEGIIIIDIKM